MRPVVLNGVLCLCSILVALLLSEGFLRLLPHFQSCPSLPDRADHAVWSLRPAHMRLHRTCPEYEATVEINSEGFRGPEFPPREKSPGIKRVLFLGDSFVEAVEVEETERFARLVADGVAPGADAVILGHGGASPINELTYYRAIGRAFHPDVVVQAFFVLNDLIEDPRGFALTESGASVAAVDPVSYEGWRMQIGKKSKLVQFLYDRLYRPLKLRVSPVAVTAKQGLGPLYKFTDDGYADLDATHTWENTRLVMETFRREVEADGARFLVVLIPAFTLVQTERLPELQQSMVQFAEPEDWDFPRLQNRVLSELHAAGITVLDPTDALRAAATPEERVFFQVDPHLTKRGNSLLAEILLPRVKTLLETD